MRPITFGRVDGWIMSAVAPLVRGWCWLTGRSAQDLARIALFIALASNMVRTVKGDWLDWAVGIVVVPFITWYGYIMINRWDQVGDRLPPPDLWLRARWLFATFALMDMVLLVQGVTLHRVTQFGFSSFLLLALYATSWVGKPPLSALSRLRQSLWMPTLARTTP